jgi:DNA-binding NarL/FixJ family response regulator
MTGPEQPSSKVGLLLSDDMLFTSRITGTARDIGVIVLPARNAELLQTLARQQPPACIIIDLSNPGLNIADLIQQLRKTCSFLPRIVGYGSHVDTATLRAAKEAGCDLVLPRSKFVEDLPTRLPEWMSGPIER